MPLLYMETDQVRAVGQQIAQAIGELSSQADSLSASADSLGSAWVSEGSSLFLQEFQGMISTIHQLAQTGDSFRNRIEAEVAEWERVANNYQSIGILPTTSTAEMDYYQKLSRFVVKQEDSNTCALFSEMVSMRALGINISYDEIKKLGWRVGYFDLPGEQIDGSRFGMGHVWKHYDVPYETFQLKDNLMHALKSALDDKPGPIEWHNASEHQQATEFLLSRLQERKAVVVGIDATPIYPDNVDPSKPWNPHQVWVAGVINDSNGSPSSVILNDTMWGEQKTVPYDKFMRAWSLKGFQAIASEESIKLP